MDHLGDIISQRQPSNSVTPPPSGEPQEISNGVNSEQPPLSSSAQEELRTAIFHMKRELDKMLQLLDGNTSFLSQVPGSTPEKIEAKTNELEQVIEGVFNGEKMIGGDGNVYDVPPNYASKSKMVEGDMLKLTINKNGNFIYKQIGPIERQRIRGTLFYSDEVSGWSIITSTGKSYKVLTASVTFYKGKAGDEVIAIIPQNGHSEWAAVEHIIGHG